jgi:hypothetical protein
MILFKRVTMEKHNVQAKANINLEVNAPCPKCKVGHFIPFLKAVPEYHGEYANPYDVKFDHYEIY